MNFCRRIKLFLSFFLLCFCILNAGSRKAYAQHFINSSRFLGIADGLASREVFCALQDNNGFIWFGTRNGLNRYDGENFVLFSKKTGLRFNTVVQLVQPDSNELWIFYGVSGFSKVGGNMVDIMNPQTHELVSFSRRFPQTPFSENEIMMMKSLGDGSYILLTSRGYFKYDLITKNFEKMYNDHAKPEYYLFYNNFFYRNYAWVNHEEKCIYFYINGREKYRFENKVKQLVIIGAGDSGNAIAIESSAYSSRFYEIDSNGETHEANGVRNFSGKPFRTRGGTNWICFNAETNSSVMTTSAMYCFEKNSLYELMDSVTMNSYPPFILYDYLVDSQNRKWVCTSIGVFIFNRKQNYFQSLFNDSSTTAFRDKFNQARSIYADKSGNIYAGIGASICHSNSIGGNLQQVYPKSSYHENAPVGAIVYAIAKDKNLYAGLTNEILILDSAFSNPVHFKTDTVGEIWTLFHLDNHRLIGGCGAGYFIYDENIKNIVFGKKILRMFLYRFVYDSEGNLWAAGASGLYQFDESGKIIAHFTEGAEDNAHRIPFSDLLDLYIDKQGIFWLATNGDGLYRWNKNRNSSQADTGKFAHFTRDDGLSSNLLYGILEDDWGNLWISSDFGLNRFDKSTHLTTIYTTADGLNNNEFNRTSFFKSEDGRMFFGGLNGVNAFYPQDFISDTAGFNVSFRIISCNIFDGKQNKLIDKTVELLSSHKVILNPGDGFFTLQFQLLDFESGKHHYAYRIDGIDRDWNYINENSIRISGLNYGDYTLHIKAQNPTGLWSTEQIAVAVNVIEPLMHRKWFLLLTGFAGIVFIFIFIRYRTYRLSKDKEALEKTVELRTSQMRKLLKDKDLLMKEIHHRVKNNLQIIGNLLEMQGENIPDEMLQGSFSEAHARVRSVAIIHHNLYRQDDLTNIEWKGFVEELAKSVSSVFEPKGKQIEIKNLVKETFFDIDTAIPLGLMLNELLTNSYKYAFNNSSTGMITIETEKISNGSYKLIYTDSGPGLAHDFNFKTISSLGLRLIIRLTEQLLGEVNYVNKGRSTFNILFKNEEGRKLEE